jgi:hypothetical protein
MAATSANQIVTFSVIPVNEIAVAGNPAAMVVNAATPGSQPDVVTDNSTTYSISSNGTNIKITGSIDTPLPTGVTLKVNLTAPTGGSSAGDVPLGVSPSDLVTGTTKVAESGLTIIYKLNATVVAGVVVTSNRTVTLTVTDGN